MLPLPVPMPEVQPSDTRTLSNTLFAGRFVCVDSEGRLWVDLPGGERIACDMLLAQPELSVQEGDEVLVHCGPGRLAIVLGRVGRYRPPEQARRQVIEARDELTLRCGDASIEMRADGKMLIRGDDVLVRAKGTKRIRAGTVSIN